MAACSPEAPGDPTAQRPPRFSTLFLMPDVEMILCDLCLTPALILDFVPQSDGAPVILSAGHQREQDRPVAEPEDRR